MHNLAGVTDTRAIAVSVAALESDIAHVGFPLLEFDTAQVVCPGGNSLLDEISGLSIDAFIKGVVHSVARPLLKVYYSLSILK